MTGSRKYDKLIVQKKLLKKIKHLTVADAID